MRKSDSFLLPLIFFFLTLSAFAFHSPVLNNFFIFDDTHWIVSAEKYTWTIRGFFSAPVLYFRPFVIILFWLERKLFGLNPFPYYAVTIAFHAANTLLVFLVARALTMFHKLENPEAAGFFSALTFSALFTHSAAVLVISASMHSMLTTFYLLCLLSFLYAYHTHRSWYYFVFFAGYVLGLLTDITMVSLPMVLIFYHCLLGIKNNRRSFLTIFYLTVCAPVLLNIPFLLCYAMLIKGSGFHAMPSGMLEFLRTVISFTGKIFLETLGLIKDAGNYPAVIVILFFLNSSIFLCFMVTEIFHTAREKKNIFMRFYFFCLSAMLISSLPYVAVKTKEMFSYDSWTRYRYSYLPSAFFCIFTSCMAYFACLKLYKIRPYVSRSMLTAFFLTVLAANIWGTRFAEKTYDSYGKIDQWILVNIAYTCEKYFRDNNAVHLINVPSIPQVAMSHSLLENLIKMYIRRDIKVAWLSDEEFQKLPAKKLKDTGCFIRLDTAVKKFTDMTP